MSVCGAAEHLSMECNVVYLNLLCYMGRNCDKIFFMALWKNNFELFVFDCVCA